MEVEHESLVSLTPTSILEHDVKRLRNKEVRLVKVQRGADPKESTCGSEERIQNSYPLLFEGTLQISYL